jgi:carbon-monoxide dehydrogenase medium subunit
MLLPQFTYHRPADLGQALAVLALHGPAAKIVAGGTDLLVNMKRGSLKPAHLVDVSGLAELRTRETQGGRLRLGANLTAAELARGEGKDIPIVLARGAGALGSPQVRNRATLGGNLVTARPAADICVPLLALGASAVLAGPQGQRETPLRGFFLAPGQTAIAPGEILTGVVIDPWPGIVAGAYCKLGLRKALEIALVSVACQISLDPVTKTILRAGISLGAVGPTPILSSGAAKALEGGTGGEEALAAAAQAAAADARPIDDHRGSAAYRRDMVEVLTRRVLEEALAQARRAQEAR